MLGFSPRDACPGILHHLYSYQIPFHFVLGLVSLVLVIRLKYIWPSKDSGGPVRYLMKCNYKVVLFFLYPTWFWRSIVSAWCGDLSLFESWRALLYISLNHLMTHTGDCAVTPKANSPFNVKCSWNTDHWLQLYLCYFQLFYVIFFVFSMVFCSQTKMRKGMAQDMTKGGASSKNVRKNA